MDELKTREHDGDVEAFLASVEDEKRREDIDVDALRVLVTASVDHMRKPYPD